MIKAQALGLPKIQTLSSQVWINTLKQGSVVLTV